MKFSRTPVLVALALGTLAATNNMASAAVAGFATGTVNERAGPGTEYPIVNVIPAGAHVTIYGCLNGWSWCDVDFAGWRGWVFGSYLQAYYQSAPVAVPYYGATLGIPFVAFSVNYWDNHYRARPWYAQRTSYFKIPGRPGTFKPEGDGAYTYYPPGEGRYKASPNWGGGNRYKVAPNKFQQPRKQPGWAVNKKAPRVSKAPKPAYALKTKPSYKGPPKQKAYFAPPKGKPKGKAYVVREKAGAKGAYVYDGPQPGGKKKCPMKDGKPRCRVAKR